MQSAVRVVVPEQIIVKTRLTDQILALHPQVLGIRQLCVPLVQQFAPCTVLCLLAHPAFRIRQALRRAVGLVMKPVNIRSIHSVNTGQRLMAVLIGVDIT